MTKQEVEVEVKTEESYGMNLKRKHKLVFLKHAFVMIKYFA